MKKIGIIMGSDSDLPTVGKAVDTLKSFGVPYEVHVFSAHRTPAEAKDFSVMHEQTVLAQLLPPQVWQHT